MKKTYVLIPITVVFLALVSCSILEQLKKGVAHTASRINSIQAIGESREFAFVDIEYVFTETGVSDEKAVFNLKGSPNSDTVDIALAGTLYTGIDTLKANTTYTYILSLLDGAKLTEYDEIEVKTLPLVSISHPADTFFGGYDPLEVRWNKLSYEGEDYLTYEVALYDGSGIDITDPDLESLLALTDPLEGPFEVTLTSSDTEGSYKFSTLSPYQVKGYIVKVSTKKALFDKLSNKSTAFKPFLWFGPPPK